MLAEAFTWPVAFAIAAIILAVPLMIVGSAWADAFEAKWRQEKKESKK